MKKYYVQEVVLERNSLYYAIDKLRVFILHSLANVHFGYSAKSKHSFMHSNPQLVSVLKCSSGIRVS